MNKSVVMVATAIVGVAFSTWARQRWPLAYDIGFAILGAFMLVCGLYPQ